MQILARIFHGKIRLPSSKSYNVERCLCTTFEYGTISEPAVLYCMKCFERSTEIAAEDDFKRAAGSCKEHRRHRSQSKRGDAGGNGGGEMKERWWWRRQGLLSSERAVFVAPGPAARTSLIGVTSIGACSPRPPRQRLKTRTSWE